MQLVSDNITIHEHQEDKEDLLEEEQGNDEAEEAGEKEENNSDLGEEDAELNGNAGLYVSAL